MRRVWSKEQNQEEQGRREQINEDRVKEDRERKMEIEKHECRDVTKEGTDKADGDMVDKKRKME